MKTALIIALAVVVVPILVGFVLPLVALLLNIGAGLADALIVKVMR